LLAFDQGIRVIQGEERRQDADNSLEDLLTRGSYRVPVASLYMGTSFQMRTSRRAIQHLVYCQWPTLDRTRTCQFISSKRSLAGVHVSSLTNGFPRNGSQFFITTAPATWLDGKHVVFGEVDKTDDSMAVVKELERLGSDEGMLKTTTRPTIADCGELPEGKGGVDAVE
jgi:Cyclophilin type peptidyl-prolyl cis-trans isomerase/CLD